MSEYCTEEEMLSRIEVCKTCDSFIIEESGTRCSQCIGGCSISFLVSHKNEICPKGKW